MKPAAIRHGRATRPAAPVCPHCTALEKALQESREQLAVLQADLEVAEHGTQEALCELELSRERYADLYDFAPNAYIVLDGNGFIRDANLTAAELLGEDRLKLRDTPFMRFVAMADHHNFLRQLSHCRRSRYPAQIATDLHLTSKRGAYLVHMLSTPDPSKKANAPQQLRYRTALVDLTEIRRAELALHASEARYRMLFEQNPCPMFIMGESSLDILDVNEAALQLYGYSREAFLAMTIKDIHPPTDVPAALAAIRANQRQRRAAARSQSSLDAGLPFRVGEWRHCKRDGTVLDVEITSSALSYAGPPARLVLVKDITARKRAEAALRESEERYRTIFNQAADSVVVFDPQTLAFVDFNDDACRRLGYSRQDFARLKLSDLEARESVAEVKRHVRKFTLSQSVVFETQLRASTGDPIDMEVRAKAIYRGDRKLIHCIWRDITERKQTEAALRESEARFRSLFENSPDALFLGTPDGHILDANPAACAMFERSKEEFLRVGRAAVPAANKAELSAAIKERARTGHVRREMKYLRKDGSEIETELLSVIITNPAGEARTLVVFRDITARKQTEAALRESEARYRAIFDQAADSVVVFDPATLSIIDFNDEACQRLDYSRRAFAKLKISDLDAHETAADVKRRIRKIVKGSVAVFETQQRTRSGALLDIEARSRTIRLGGKTLILGMWRDITARKRAEEELRRRAEEIETLMEIAPAAIWVAHDPACQKITGNRRANELSGAGPQENLSVQVPGARRFFRAGRALAPREMPMQVAIAAGKEVRNTELEMLGPGGQRITLLGNAQPLRGPDGKIRGCIAAFIDISARKWAEEAVGRAAQEWTSTFDGVSDAVWVLDLQQHILRCNKAATKLFGKSASDMVGRPCWEIVHGTRQPISQCPVTRMRRSGKRETMELELGDRWYQVVVDPLRDAHGALRGAVHAVSDITARKQAEEALRKIAQELELRVTERTAEVQRLAAIVQRSSELISLATPELRGVFINDAGAQLLGIAPADIGRHQWSDFLPEEEQLRFHTQIMPVVRQGRVWQGELRYRHCKSGTVSYGATAMFPILDPATSQVRYLATTSVDISARKELEHQVLEISEREQRRIGHDLHDSVGQQLAAVKFLSGTLSKRLTKEHLSGAPAAAQIERELQQAMEEVRAIARGLQPIRPDGESLMSALYELTKGVTRLFKLPCHFICPRRIMVHDFLAATHLFRIAQEAVSNATRHAQARHIWLRLANVQGGVRLRVEDDGCGLPADPHRPQGMGLRIMNYRASVIGASFSLAPRPGGGTCISCDWKPSTTHEKGVTHAPH